MKSFRKFPHINLKLYYLSIAFLSCIKYVKIIKSNLLQLIIMILMQQSRNHENLKTIGRKNIFNFILRRKYLGIASDL